MSDSPANGAIPGLLDGIDAELHTGVQLGDAAADPDRAVSSIGRLAGDELHNGNGNGAVKPGSSVAVRGMDAGLKHGPSSSNNTGSPNGAFADRIAAALKKLRGDGDSDSAETAVVADSTPDTRALRSDGPVGGGEHVVRQGECTASIAKDAGHFWQTIWDDPANADLREGRENPYVLLPGDRVHVPPLREKWEPGQSEMRHRFVRKGQPEVFRVRVLRDGEPRGNEPYTLDVDGAMHAGTTDADGKLSCPIAANARRATLRVGAESDVDEYRFRLGAIDPLDQLSGVQGRLNNLGFDCGPVDGKWGPHTERALKQYQERRRLPVTGQADAATRQKLREDHGC